MATATKTTPITLHCPHCGVSADPDSGDGVVGMVLHIAERSLFCNECAEQVSREDLEKVRGQVDRLLRLLDLAAEV